MELKLAIEEDVFMQLQLLIVPYGIETVGLPDDSYLYSLLIVPYGIETKAIKR